MKLGENGTVVREPTLAESADPKVLTTFDKPFQPTGGLKMLTGNLGKAVIKISAVKADRHVIEAPAKIFHDQSELQTAFKAGTLTGDFIAVVRFQGPKANGMPELHKLTTVLGILQDRGQRVALVTDGRMSGASGKVPSAIHLTPEPWMAGRSPASRKAICCVSTRRPAPSKCWYRPRSSRPARSPRRISPAMNSAWAANSSSPSAPRPAPPTTAPASFSTDARPDRAMTDFTLRPAGREDIPAMMAIERMPGFDALVGRSSAEQHAANIDGGENRYFLAEDADGVPLAFAILQGIGHSNGLVYLKRIAVATPGNGLGKRFLLALIAKAFEEFGAAKFWLDAFTTNSRARHVYAACGLSEDGILREHYPLPDGSRADLVVMSILKREWLARKPD